MYLEQTYSPTALAAVQGLDLLPWELKCAVNTRYPP